MSPLTTTILALSIVYAALGVLLLATCMLTRLPWPVKATAVAMVSAFYVVGYFETHALLGWSSDGPLPSKFKLLGVRVVEPLTKLGDPGAIYLWVEEIDEDNFPSGVPRSYKLPFTAKLADRAEAAVKASAEGHPQGGRTADMGAGEGGYGQANATETTPTSILTTDGGDTSAGGALNPGFTHSEGLVFTPLLPPKMPAKDDR